MAPPISKLKKVQKRAKKFVRHQSDRKIAVKVSAFWAAWFQVSHSSAKTR
jgi:hypothetical protein